MATTIFTPSMLKGAGTRGVPEIPVGSSFTNTYSMAFDGVDDYIDCGNISDLNGVTTATWSGWFKRTGASNYYLMSTWGATGGLKQFAPYQTGVEMSVYMANSGAAQQLMFQNTSLTFTTGTWYHLAFVYNEAEASNADKMKFYINSVVQTNNVAGAALTTLNSSTANFEIGKLGGYLTNGFNGKIDEVSIFDSVVDVATLYNSGIPGDLTSLSPIYWNRMGD